MFSFRINSLGVFVVKVCLVLGVFCYGLLINCFNFTYTDEIIVLMILFCWILCPCKQKAIKKEFYCFIGISAFYLCYSLYIATNVPAANFIDYLIEIKPFIVFYSISILDFEFTESNKRSIRRLCLFLAILMMPIGIIYVISNSSIMDNIFSYPAQYASAAQILGLCYLYFSKRSKKNFLIASAIILLSVLSLRSKAYGFVAAYFFIVYFKKHFHPQKIKILNLFLLLCCVVSLTIYVAWEKFSLYVFTGTEERWARPALYLGMLDILKDYPLFGSGLGTYGTFGSVVYYSPLYTYYNLDNVYGLEEDHIVYACDTFFPTLCQIGFIGIGLFTYFWWKRYKIAIHNFTTDYDLAKFIMVLLIMVFFAIESTADSTFTQNRGMVMMMILALVLNDKENSIKGKHSN